jgi:predicted O-methyltransferase YrrM
MFGSSLANYELLCEAFPNNARVDIAKKRFPAAMSNPSWTFKDDEFKRIWDRASPFTTISPERGYALYTAVRHIVEHRIYGALVECGTRRGGSAMIILLTLKALGITGRDVILFDAFDGITEVSDRGHDRALAGIESGKEGITERESSPARAVVSEAEVRSNLKKCGYSPKRIRLVRGDVCKTLPHTQTGPIALLHLDTACYESTRVEMIQLFPRVVQSGVVMVDDHSESTGARKAVDEYFSERKDRLRKPLLHAIDDAGRVFVKIDAIENPDIARYDYAPPGLTDPQLMKYFPTLEAFDPTLVRWPYLRHRAPHLWRIDRRADPHIPIGVLSLEEALLLYNLAKPFSGRRALEIGCHYAWSTAHLLAAGLQLDVVDPALADSPHRQHVVDSLSQIDGAGTYKLWPGYSPFVIQTVHSARTEPWSFTFIDGNHDRPGPRLDAEAVLPHCADDAMVVFHDLVSPDVAEGLRYFKEQGWQCRIYNTMQIMGVAWRGNISPVAHVSDPNVPEFFQAHLTDLREESRR